MNKSIPVKPLTPQSKQLNGDVYLVTGSTGGLGRETALALAKLGATVILTGRNEKKLDTLYDEIEQAGYPTPAIIPFDLEQTDEEVYTQLINSIYKEFKQLNGLVHVACNMGVVGPIGSQASSTWQKSLQINLNSAALLSKACIPLLQQSKRASISFISDSSARQSNAYWGSYGVSKVAIESLSTMLADELDSTSICCNTFIPGPCILPIRKKTHPGEDESTLSTANEIADSFVNVVLCKETGQCFSHQSA